MSTNPPVPESDLVVEPSEIPEKNLFFAMLERALRDYLETGTLDEKIANRRDAERWLFRANGPFSLAWGAEYVITENSDTWLENVRAYAKRMREAGRKDIPSLWSASHSPRDLIPRRKKDARRKKLPLAQRI